MVACPPPICRVPAGGLGFESLLCQVLAQLEAKQVSFLLAKVLQLCSEWTSLYCSVYMLTRMAGRIAQESDVLFDC